MYSEKPLKGIVVVATMNVKYFKSAINCISSIKDHSDFHVTLFTEEHFLNGTENIADVVRTDIPKNARTKLWALNKVPYDITAYIDADMYVIDDEFTNLFDQLEDYDIAITQITPAIAAQTFIDYERTLELVDHCGFFIYKNSTMNPIMEKWWEYWLDQRENFEEKFPEYVPGMRNWDQFAWWRICNDYSFSKKYIGKEWNWIYLLDNLKQYSETDPIIYHGGLT